MKVNKSKLSKTTKNDMITYGMVILTYIVVQLLVSTGHVSSLIQGLLVPFCTYVIVAVALNLTVGILGELSLGHAGFMCVGAFASAVFSLAFKEALVPVFPGAADRGGIRSAGGISGGDTGTAAAG